MASEAIGEASNRRVGDPGLSGNLAKSGAGYETVEDGLEAVASAEPIVRPKGL